MEPALGGFQFSEKVMDGARRLVKLRDLEPQEPPLARLHRELAEYKRRRDEALTDLTLALVEVGQQVNGAAEPDPDDWFAA